MTSHRTTYPPPIWVIDDWSRIGQWAQTVDALSQTAFRVSSEEELQAAIAGELELRGVPFEREVHGVSGRIDFLIGDDLGLEVKVDGSPGAVLEQLSRYAASGRFRHLILATTRRRLGRGVPDILAGIPVEVVHLRAPL
jgi:hypothetical protein